MTNTTNTTAANTVSAIVANTKAKKATRKAALPKSKAMIRAEETAALMGKVAKGRQTRSQKIEASREMGRNAPDVVPMIPTLRRDQERAEMTVIAMCEAITKKCGGYPHWNTVKADTHNAKFAYDTWMAIRKELHMAAFFAGYPQKNHYELLLKNMQTELLGESKTRDKKDDDAHTKATITALYKRLMRIPNDAVSEAQCRRIDKLGTFLKAEFGIDLSTLNV